MDASSPLLSEPPPAATGDPSGTQAHWRWGVHFGLLACYPLGIGLLGRQARQAGEGGAAFADSTQLIQATLLEMVLFSLVLGAAWLFSRVRADQLLLRWRRGWLPLPLGLGYSVGLRLLLGLLVTAGLVLYSSLGGGDFQEAANAIKPEVGTLIDIENLLNDPVYLWLNLTWVSFVVAGAREELWRAALLAGLGGLWPRFYARPAGKACAVFVAACIFGLGHLPQGWGAVGMTGILGLGLGLIMVWHQSIWEAVLAHGFFNASTFLMLYLLQKHFPELLEGFALSGGFGIAGG